MQFELLGVLYIFNPSRTSNCLFPGPYLYLFNFLTSGTLAGSQTNRAHKVRMNIIFIVRRTKTSEQTSAAFTQSNLLRAID
jgi:hypothetical protein